MIVIFKKKFHILTTVCVKQLKHLTVESSEIIRLKVTQNQIL